VNSKANLPVPGSQPKIAAPRVAASVVMPPKAQSLQRQPATPAPPVYRPAASARPAPPPVYSPKAIPTAAQRKPASGPPPVYKPVVATRPAPPVYSARVNPPAVPAYPPKTNSPAPLPLVHRPSQMASVQPVLQQKPQLPHPPVYRPQPPLSSVPSRIVPVVPAVQTAQPKAVQRGVVPAGMLVASGRVQPRPVPARASFPVVQPMQSEDWDDSDELEDFDDDADSSLDIVTNALIQPKMATPTGAHHIADVIQLGRTTAPKALRYKSFQGKPRKKQVTKLKKKQYNLNRGRKLHVRHIIPHSDLQAWMLAARVAGGALSNAGQMRRIIYNLLVFFADPEAANWQNCYQNYENSGYGGSLLQYDPAGVNQTWGVIEWHPKNLFLGHAGLNSAIQNRFDAGRGAVAFRGQAYINNLHAIWHAANGLLGLNPTAIQETTVYSVWLHYYVIIHAAEHNGSRPLQAAPGKLHRSDYIRTAP